MSLCVVVGFEEDRASRHLGEISDGWSNCVPSRPLSHHGECVGHGTSNIEIRVVLSLTEWQECRVPIGAVTSPKREARHIDWPCTMLLWL